MAQSRREFLKSAVGASALVSLSGAAPSVLARAARAAAGDDRRNTVLVVLQLSGGNDGLNTVAPYADDAYARSRTTLRLTRKDVHRIDDHVGFHPRMKGFARLLSEGRLGVIQGVGYPKSHRGHEEAMRNWHTAMPDRPQCPTGWVGRAVDTASAEGDGGVPGVFVGPIRRPFALTARKAVVPAIRSARELTLQPAPGREPAAPRRNPKANPLADYVRRAGGGARTMSRRIQAVLDGAPASARYPDQVLARHLRTVAELIRADVGVRIVFAELGGGGIGGFDNHAVQRDNHAAMLAQLSDSVTAFADDLARHKCLDRVALLTFSEFGRTLTENGRRGTGHGAAAPMFLVGGRVRAGLIGRHPSLTDLDQDAPKFHTDFRQVYATALTDWLGLDADTVLGAKFQRLDLFTS